MSRGHLDRAVKASGVLVAGGVLAELVSFVWVHPLAFLLCGVVGGGLIAVGVGVFLVAAVRGKAWADPIEPGPLPPIS